MVDRAPNFRPSELYINKASTALPSSTSNDDIMTRPVSPVEIHHHANDTIAMFSGYLMKRGSMFHQWQQRYYMLDGQYLDQFKSDADLHQSNKQAQKNSKRIDLSHYSIRSLSPSTHSRPFCFMLQPNNQSNKQSYLFSARSERERSGWVDSINQSIRDAKHQNKQSTTDTVISSRDQSQIHTDSNLSKTECATCHTRTTNQSINLTLCETCNQSFCRTCLAHPDADQDSMRPVQCEACFQRSHQQTELSMRTTQRRNSDQSASESTLLRRGSDDNVMSDSIVDSSELLISIPATKGERLADPLLSRSSSNTPVLLVSQQVEATKELISPLTEGAFTPPNSPIMIVPDAQQPLSPVSPQSPSSSVAAPAIRPNLTVVIPLDTTPSIKVLSTQELEQIQRNKILQSLRSPRMQRVKPWWMCWA